MVHDDWVQRASCRDHPVLPAVAWDDLVTGYPGDEGAAALLVCRFQCPVRMQCRENYQGIETIAGGGWWDSNGIFREPVDGLLDVYAAAAYSGVTVEKVRRLMQDRKIPVAKRIGVRSWFTLEAVLELTRKYGPKHGTYGAYRAHVIRGEELCTPCQSLADLLHSTPNLSSSVVSVMRN